MNKINIKFVIITFLLCLYGCKPVEQPLNPDWHQVNEMTWSIKYDMPYPFTSEYGEIYCDDVNKSIFFYPLDSGNDENAVGVPLNEAAKEVFKKSGYKMKVSEDLKRYDDVKQLQREVLSICGF